MNETLFEEVIKAMQQENLNMQSLIITCDSKEYKHIFTNERFINIRSISKTMTSLALGIAIEKGYFKNGLEEYIMPYFESVKISNEDNIKYLEKTKLKHLVTLSMGYEEMILNEKHTANLGETDLCELALNYPIKHNPGEFFFYTNAPIYLLSMIIEKVVGMKLSQFVGMEVLDKIGITDYTWVESKQGHSMGCTGLTITPNDLHKIGKLFLNNGKYNNLQIIPSNWFSEMTKLQIETPNNYDESRALPKYGYGFNLWVCKNGIYYHDGSDGQYMIVVPNKNMVITTTADQNNMKPITACMKKLFEEE